MTVLALTEAGPAIRRALAAEQARKLARSGIVDIRPDDAPGHWRVRADRYVGAARVGDLEVHIAPKVRTDRLLFLVGYAMSGRHWRDEDVRAAEAPDLVPVLAEAVWRQTERALRHGLLQGYRSVDESSPVLRGRLREADQLRRHRGQPWPLEIRHDEFTVDIAENQLLRTAVERMLRVPRVGGTARQRLRHLAARLAAARVIPRGVPPPGWFPSRLNARYQPALRLAALVLRATSIEYGEGTVPVTGLLLDMPRVFEDFLTTALREALEPAYGGRVASQLPRPFDEAGRVTIRPDIVWFHGSAPVTVVDAKYKVEQPTGYPNADLYQLHAYCTALGVRHGHLVYAAGGEPTTHTVRNARVEITYHALDLAEPPAALLAQIERLGARLAGSAGRTPVRAGLVSRGRHAS